MNGVKNGRKQKKLRELEVTRLKFTSNEVHTDTKTMYYKTHGTELINLDVRDWGFKVLSLGGRGCFSKGSVHKVKDDEYIIIGTEYLTRKAKAIIQENYKNRYSIYYVRSEINYIGRKALMEQLSKIGDKIRIEERFVYGKKLLVKDTNIGECGEALGEKNRYVKNVSEEWIDSNYAMFMEQIKEHIIKTYEKANQKLIWLLKEKIG